jgi:hypothetical protein
MPYKSQAQRRLFHWLAGQGKLSPKIVEEYDRESKGKKMPEYAKKMAMGGEVMEPTTYRARGGEVKRSVRGSVEYKAKSAKEFLEKLDSAVARIKRTDDKLPYNPAPYHERSEENRRPAVMSPDPSIPKQESLYSAMAWHKKILPKHLLGDDQEYYENDPSPENAQRVQRRAKELAKEDPEFAEEWRKNTSGRMGDLKAVDRYARGGEVSGGLRADLKELYVSAIKRRRK